MAERLGNEMINMEKPLVSIIVPVYNVSQYLNECVDSLINQSYSNTEILLIDDGSKDGSGLICDAYSEKNANVHAFHKRNGGLSDARNFGTLRATGEYITYVDSDDFVARDYVRRLLECLEEQHADISVCSYIKFLHAEEARERITGTSRLLSREDAISDMMYQNNITTSAWGKMYRTEIAKKHPFPKGKLFEDLATVHKYFLESDSIALTKDDLYFYRDNPSGIMNTRQNRFMNDLYEIINDIEKFYLDNDLGILSAVHSRKFSAYCQLLKWLPDDVQDEETKDKVNRIWNFIREYRWKEVLNSKARKKNRIAALCTILGQRAFKFLLSFV